MPLGRILPRPSRIVSVQRAWPMAWPSLARRAYGTRAPRRRCRWHTGGGAGKGTAGPHWRVDGVMARARGIDGGTRMARRCGEGDCTMAYRRSR
jgi:hypothetical protein